MKPPYEITARILEVYGKINDPLGESRSRLKKINFIRLVLACKEDPRSFLDEVIKCALKIQAKL